MNDHKNRTSEEIQSFLTNTKNEQLTHERDGDYVGAEECRLKVEQLKKDLQVRRLYQMQQRHRNQYEDLKTNHQDQLNQFQTVWDKKINEFKQQFEKQQKDMLARHQAEILGMKTELQKQLPTKIKQSSQLLNLRKMEEHMVKQKNYVEAHKVQTKAQDLENHQKQSWMINRNIKIQTNLNQLRNKQNIQLTALKKKINTSFDQLDKQKHKQQTRLDKKFNNQIRQQRSYQQKQVIQFKGQFKSKGGNSSPSKSRSNY